MQELIEKAKCGDKDAFTTLVTYFESDLYKIAKTRLKNDDDIADAFQETMLKAFKSIKKLKHNEYFKTWLIKILINNCNTLYRKKTSKLGVQIEELKEETCSIDRENLEIEITDGNLDFEFIIRHLNYDERIALTLYYAEGYTNKEIAEYLNTSENTIKSRIARAKNKLKIMEGKING